jgi:hypothetical protein
VKSLVEGSTAALVRLQTPVVFSDFVRPICLPDDEYAKNLVITDYPVNSALSSGNLIDQPHAEKYFGKIRKSTAATFTEDRQFFQITDKEEGGEESEENQSMYHEITASELVDEHMNPMKPEPQFQANALAYYPNSVHEKNKKTVEHKWSQCNTLGWSRQREHLQRVQLKVIDMKACENVSIATVNSLCAEAAFHKQDCNVS